MRMSELFLRTLREDPADAEVDSHRLLLRAGYIRRVVGRASTPGCRSGRGCCARSRRSCARRWTAAGAQEVIAADRAAARAVGAHRPRRGLRRPDVPPAPTARTPAYCLSPTAEEVVTTLVAQEYGSLPRPAGEPLPDQLEVPRRDPAPLRAAARPRVPDEGRVLLRPRRRRPARELPAHVRRVPPGLRAVRAHVPAGRGAVGRDGRRREPRVHGGRRGRRRRLRVVQGVRLRRQRRGRAARRRPPIPARRTAAPTCRRARRCTRPTCPGIAGRVEVPRRRGRRDAEVHRLRRRRRARPRDRARRPRGQRVRARGRARAEARAALRRRRLRRASRAAEGLHRPRLPGRGGRGRRSRRSRRRSAGSPARTSSTTTCATRCSVATSTSTCGPTS